MNLSEKLLRDYFNIKYNWLIKSKGSKSYLVH